MSSSSPKSALFPANRTQTFPFGGIVLVRAGYEQKIGFPLFFVRLPGSRHDFGRKQLLDRRSPIMRGFIEIQLGTLEFHLERLPTFCRRQVHILVLIIREAVNKPAIIHDLRSPLLVLVPSGIVLTVVMVLFFLSMVVVVVVVMTTRLDYRRWRSQQRRTHHCQRRGCVTCVTVTSTSQFG